ncbi:helix-turn-helix transcriptional regulator [Chitinophagaceae bacterium MMS25-I14]
MPVNKAARFRFEIIDECLRNTARKWSKAELLRYVNRRLELHFGSDTSISVSQLRYDIESMQAEYGAPVEMYKDGRNYYYRYEEPDFSIKSIPIDEEDIVKLNNAVQLLQQIKGFTIADDIAEIVKRLESRYKFVNNGDSDFISFESSPELHGMENLEDIYHAIIRQNVLRISYQTFRAQQPRSWHIHPYLLKEYDNRWYLLGYTEEKSSIGIFALDRMREIKVVKKPFIKNEFVNGEDYFRDVIGVTILPDRKPEAVELYFYSAVAPYIKTKPMHHSQEILSQDEDGNMKVRIQVVPNPELLNILLGYGKDVKVLQPAWLADEVKKIAADLLDHYKE